MCLGSEGKNGKAISAYWNAPVFIGRGSEARGLECYHSLGGDGCLISCTLTQSVSQSAVTPPSLMFAKTSSVRAVWKQVRLAFWLDLAICVWAEHPAIYYYNLSREHALNAHHFLFLYGENKFMEGSQPMALSWGLMISIGSLILQQRGCEIYLNEGTLSNGHNNLRLKLPQGHGGRLWAHRKIASKSQVEPFRVEVAVLMHRNLINGVKLLIFIISRLCLHFIDHRAMTGEIGSQSGLAPAFVIVPDIRITGECYVLCLHHCSYNRPEEWITTPGVFYRCVLHWHITCKEKETSTVDNQLQPHRKSVQILRKPRLESHVWWGCKMMYLCLHLGLEQAGYQGRKFELDGLGDQKLSVALLKSDVCTRPVSMALVCRCFHITFLNNLQVECTRLSLVLMSSSTINLMYCPNLLIQFFLKLYFNSKRLVFCLEMIITHISYGHYFMTLIFFCYVMIALIIHHSASTGSITPDNPNHRSLIKLLSAAWLSTNLTVQFMILLQWKSWKKKPWFGAWKVSQISSESQFSLFPPWKMSHSKCSKATVLSFCLYKADLQPSVKGSVQNYIMLYIIKLIFPLGYSSKHHDCIIAKDFFLSCWRTGAHLTSMIGFVFSFSSSVLFFLIYFFFLNDCLKSTVMDGIDLKIEAKTHKKEKSMRINKKTKACIFVCLCTPQDRLGCIDFWWCGKFVWLWSMGLYKCHEGLATGQISFRVCILRLDTSNIVKIDLLEFHPLASVSYVFFSLTCRSLVLSAPETHFLIIQYAFNSDPGGEPLASIFSWGAEEFFIQEYISDLSMIYAMLINVSLCSSIIRDGYYLGTKVSTPKIGYTPYVQQHHFDMNRFCQKAWRHGTMSPLYFYSFLASKQHVKFHDGVSGFICWCFKKSGDSQVGYNRLGHLLEFELRKLQCANSARVHSIVTVHLSEYCLGFLMTNPWIKACTQISSKGLVKLQVSTSRSSIKYHLKTAPSQDTQILKIHACFLLLSLPCIFSCSLVFCLLLSSDLLLVPQQSHDMHLSALLVFYFQSSIYISLQLTVEATNCNLTTLKHN
ncbi:hypothetical protein VP01_616g2 [Puccinia sorghi]|uniref:Uncharacterized protein n=1 Tax=Puccinia sorghi TaxID=27349 RepID=A0A0L6UGR5_9BASI|nr:hypothetical protein VP01_616g2 [Puccinia sorghi]